MVVKTDEKRRVVLPKTVKPGEVFECLPTGDGFVLERLQPPVTGKPPVSKVAADAALLAEIDLDEPAFLPLNDQSID